MHPRHVIKVAQPRKVYPAVGRCIYCGCVDTKLTLEHIIPRGLAGNWELPESSCESCRDKTGGAEQSVLRSSIGLARIALGFRSSKPKDRPTRAAITVDGREIQIPIEDYPAVMTVPLPPPPGILTGRQPTGTWQPKYFVIVENEARERAQEKYGQPIGFTSGDQNPLIWARMLAKIAYSWVVAEKGVDSFTSFVTPLICQETESWEYFVGANPPPADYHNHVPGTLIHHLEQRNVVLDGRILIVVTLRLFARYGGPSFLVVVGETHLGNEKFPPSQPAMLDHTISVGVFP